MPESYSVRIAKAEHVFSAAHFITFDGRCERLHGHNYRVSAEVFGPLNEDYLVVDFLVVRDELARIVGELDHYTLLPSEHRDIRVVEQGESVTVEFENRRWVFPRDDCRLLPLANTTAELLATYIGRRLQVALADRCGVESARLRVQVDECDGQQAIWEYLPGQDGRTI